MAGAAARGDGLDLGAVESVRQISGEGKLLVWLTIILAMSGPSLAAFMTGPIAPLGSHIAQRFGGGDEGGFVAQLALTLPGIGVMVGGPLVGWFLPRFGFRKTIIGCALLFALAGALGGWIDGMVPFLASRLLVGLGSVGIYTALISLAGALYSGQTLARMLSYQNGVSAAMGMVLILLSGWVAHAFGWRASFGLYFLLLLYALFPLFVWLPQAAPKKAAAAAEPLPAPTSIKPFVPLLVLTVAVFAAVFLVIVQGSLLLNANGISDPSTQAIVISASTVTFAIVGTACSWIERHVTGRFTLAAALTSMGLGALVMGAFPALPFAILGSLLLGAGSGLSSTYLFRAVIERASGEQRERVSGFILPAHYLGQLSNPFIMEGLRTQVSLQSAFLIVGAALIIGALSAALFGRRRAPVAPAIAGGTA